MTNALKKISVSGIAEMGLSARAIENIGKAKSPATLRAYKSDWSIFVNFCKENQVDFMPASPLCISEFLTNQADQNVKASTLNRRLAAIAFFHEMQGVSPLPTKDKGVTMTLQGIRRSIGVAPDKKKPLTADLARLAVALAPDTLKGKRDKALLLLGFAGAFRRSELSALQVSDITQDDDGKGIDILIRQSKTDQEGKGAIVSIVKGQNHCPCLALQDWLTSAGIDSGPIFRGFRKGDKPRDAALSDQAIYNIVKEYAGKSGFDPADFGAHSLRSGFLTSAAERGASVTKMQAVSRHKSVDVLMGYVRHADRFKDHAGQGLL